MANELVTRAEVEAYLRTPTSASVDADVDRFISAVSARLDQLCGPFVIRTVSNEAHDGGRVDRRRSSVQLDQPPATITTVTEYAATTPTVLSPETPGTQPAAAYLYDPRTATIYRRASGQDWFFPSGRRNILVTYEAGRVADTASVSPRHKEAALITIGHLWRTERGAGTQAFGDTEGLVPGFGFAIPRRALELLADDMRVVGIA